MKKVILSAVLVAFATVGFSQAKVEIGLKGGVNMSDLSGDAGDNITAFHGGAYTLIKVSKLGIQPEILFSKRGSDQIDLSYVDVPVMLKMYIAGGFNIQAGPQFGFNMNAEDENGNDVSDFIKSSDLSIAAGAGVDLPMGLNVTARYIIGMSDINDTGLGDDIKQNTFQFSVGYKLFKLGN